MKRSLAVICAMNFPFLYIGRIGPQLKERVSLYLAGNRVDWIIFCSVSEDLVGSEGVVYISKYEYKNEVIYAQKVYIKKIF